MRTFIAMLGFSITATLGVALHALKGVAAVAAAGPRPLSSPPTGSPDSSYAPQASTKDTVTPSSQLTSEGSVALDGVKAVGFLVFLGLAWRIWGRLKNTDVWRNVLALLGADPAAQPDEGPAAHGRLLRDGDPAAGLRELVLGPVPTPAGTAGASSATETQLAIFTRECTWTSTSSSMAIREFHVSQPTSTSAQSKISHAAYAAINLGSPTVPQLHRSTPIPSSQQPPPTTR